MALHAALKYLSAASLLTMTLSAQSRTLHDRRAAGGDGERFDDFLRRAAAPAKRAEQERIAEEYWKKAKHFGRPVVEDSTIYFMYLGKARRVGVPSDLNGWNPSMDTMVRLNKTNFFYLSKTIHPASRFEYKLTVDTTWMLDPINRQQAMGGYGPNSEIWMPGYQPPQDIIYRTRIRHGQLDTTALASKVLKRTYPCFIYLPPGYTKSRLRYPAIFVLDGGEYITLGLMVNVLDNLISEKRIRPVIGVFLDPRTNIRNSRTSKRRTDYTMNERFVKFLAAEVHPWITSNYRVTQRADQTAILGASLGGLAATFVAFRRPDVFGLCAAQSPSYHYNDESLIHSIARGPRKAIKFYVDTGTISDAEVHSRHMKAVLEDKGYELRYGEYPEGHSWGNWRARLADILTYFWGTQG